MNEKKEKTTIENETIYRILAENSGDFIALHDINGRFLYASPSVKKISGYERGELVGSLPFDFIHKDDIKIAKRILEAILAAKNITSIQYRFRHKNGSYIWLETTIRVQNDDDGNPQRIVAINRDITRRKLNEKILKENEEKFRVLFETAKDAIFIIELDKFYILDANQSACTMYGYSVEEFRNLKITDISVEKESTREALQKGKLFIPERYHRKKDGTLFPIEVNATRYRINNTDLHVAFIRDISDRKKSEIALKSSEFKFRSLLEKIQCGIIVHGPDTSILTVNPYAQDILGLTEKQLIGKKNNDDDWHFFRSDESVMPPDEFPVQLAMTTKKPVREYIVGVYRSATKDKVWALTNADPELNDRGEISQIVVTFVNITRRKIAETDLERTRKRFQVLNDLTIEGIILHENGVITDANPSVLKMVRVNKEELIGDTIFSYIHPKDQKRIKQRLREKNTSITEVIIVRKDGTSFIADAEANQMEVEGQLFRVVAVRDITKRKKAEEALIRSEHELREANITKDKFFSIIAHDLKSPFNILLGYSDLLLNNFNEFDNDERDNLVQTIHETSQKTYNLVQNLLVWSRTQTKRIEFIPQKFEITHLINENIALYKETAAKKQIRLLYSSEKNLYVVADIEMIATVLRNLINNAIKFTHKEGIVEIHTRVNKENMLNVTVSDTGIGISPQNLTKIFKIDEDYNTRGTENETGTGLGLILCKEFIEKNGGHIWAKSKKDKGSDFHFSLPLAEKE